MAAIYDAPPLNRAQSLSLFFFGLLIVILPLGWGVYLFYYAYTNFGPAAVSAWSVPWFLTAAIFLFVFVFFGLRLWQRTHFAILVYSNGLRFGSIQRATQHKMSKRLAIARKPNGDRDWILPWESITGIAIDRVAATKKDSPRHTIILTLNSGKQVTIGEIRAGWETILALFGPMRVQNLPELATRIKACLYPRLLPELRKAFLDGHRLSFGALAIQQASIHLPGCLPTRWSDIKRMTVREGKLVVELVNSEKTHSEVRIPVSKVPNLELLFQLVDDLAVPG